MEHWRKTVKALKLSTDHLKYLSVSKTTCTSMEAKNMLT